MLGAPFLLSRLVLSCLVLAWLACWEEVEGGGCNKSEGNNSVGLNNASTIISSVCIKLGVSTRFI